MPLSTNPAADVESSPIRGPGQQRRWRLVMSAVCVLGLAFNTLAMLPALPHILRGDNDFMNFYAGATLAGSPKLYHLADVARVEERFWDEARALPFARPPFYGILISPLRWFSYQTARRIWLALSLMAVAAFIAVFPARSRWLTAAGCCWSLPLVVCFIMGQDLAFVILVIALCLALLDRGKPFTAGCLISLCTIKFNLFFTLPVLILGRREWKFMQGAVAGVLLLLGISFAIQGLSWPMEYLALLRLPTTTPVYPGLMNLHGLFAGAPNLPIWEAVGACVSVALVWHAARSRRIGPAFAAMLIAGLLVSHHAFPQDATTMIPAGLLLIESEGVISKLAGLLVLCPLPYLTLMMPHMLVHPAVPLLLALALISFAVWQEKRVTKAAAAP